MKFLLCKALFLAYLTFRILIALLIHSNSLNTSQFDKKKIVYRIELKLI